MITTAVGMHVRFEPVDATCRSRVFMSNLPMLTFVPSLSWQIFGSLTIKCRKKERFPLPSTIVLTDPIRSTQSPVHHTGQVTSLFGFPCVCVPSLSWQMIVFRIAQEKRFPHQDNDDARGSPQRHVHPVQAASPSRQTFPASTAARRRISHQQDRGRCGRIALLIGSRELGRNGKGFSYVGFPYVCLESVLVKGLV